MTNEFIIAVCGDSGAVRQSIIAARDMGKKLLSAFGQEPKSDTVPYI
jgi:ethanolamine utilization microcompartment shell protein EutL